MTYCDTNILTAFVNRGQLSKLGTRGFDRFKENIKGQRDMESEKALKNVNKCVIDRNTLLSDIGNHQPAVGAILTSVNLKNIKIKKIEGLKEGKKIYNKACSKVDETSGFYQRFCKHRKLKENLKRNHRNDVRHFGSAIKSNSKIFLTNNLKDFKPLEEFTNIKIEGGS